MGRFHGLIWENPQKGPAACDPENQSYCLEWPSTDPQLDHKAVAVGGIAQVQHTTITNVNRRRGHNIYSDSPDAIDWVSCSESCVRRARPRKHQAIVFVHELQALCGKQNKTGAYVDLVGLPQIPRSARARIASDLIAQIADQRNEVEKIVARSHHDQIVERARLRPISEQAAQRIARWNDSVITDG